MKPAVCITVLPMVLSTIIIRVTRSVGDLDGKILFPMQDGLGDTIRVSLTEPPEEEIDPCRRLANLGTRAAELQQGVVG